MRVRYVWLVLLLVLLAPLKVAVAAPGDPVDVQQLQQQVAQLQAEVTKLQAEKEHYDYLTQEVQGFREFVQQEREGLQKFMESIALIVGAVATFFLGASWVEARKQIASISSKALKQYEEQVAEQLGAQKKEIVRDLNELRRGRWWYERTRLLVVGEQDAFDRLADGALRILKEKGLHVRHVRADAPNLSRLLREDGAVVVYLHGGGEDQPDSDLLPVADQVRDCGSLVPLIVYKEGRMNTTELGLLRKQCEWYTLANNSITLVSHVHSLAHLFAHQVTQA